LSAYVCGQGVVAELRSRYADSVGNSSGLVGPVPVGSWDNPVVSRCQAAECRGDGETAALPLTRKRESVVSILIESFETFSSVYTSVHQFIQGV
jgi:hypothetical protein